MFWEDLEKVDKKGLIASDTRCLTYPTGITVLDYANGFWLDQVTAEGTKQIPMIGISGGTMVSIIGNTGVGKTTFALQMGWNIVRNFKDGMLFLVDCEKAMIPQRMYNLLGLPMDDPRARLLKAHTTIDDTLEIFKNICEVKEAAGKKVMYEESRSHDGKPFLAYAPTVMIIDSLPSFNSKEYNIEDLGGNADQMRASKDITRFYIDVLDRAYKYNIIFVIINHIKPATNLNPYAPPPKGIMMIDPKIESLPRGFAAQFYSTTYFRIRMNKSSAKTKEDNGFDGYSSQFQLAKTKSNKVGTVVPVTFANADGFDPVYSIYEFAEECGLIKGRNPYLYFEGFDSFKFSRKNFISLFSADDTFRTGVLGIMKPFFEALLGDRRFSPLEAASIEVDENGEIIEREGSEIQQNQPPTRMPFGDIVLPT